MIALCIPTLRRFDTLTACIESALAGTRVPDHIYIVDNSGGNLMRYAEQYWTHIMHPIHIVIGDKNLGVAGSWNFFLNEVPGDVMIMSNDDVTFEKNTIEVLTRAVEGGTLFAYPDAVNGDGNTLNAFSLYATSHLLFSRIGNFDETFYPAYFEDNDYAHRMAKEGIPLTPVACRYNHVGSATMKAYTPTEMEQHHHAFRANEAYYIRKWGGPPGKETR